jgi:dTDP-4-amino-4,6-dideoxygalactose transaminase
LEGSKKLVNNNPIPFYIPVIGDDEIKAVTDVLRSSWLTMGPKVIEFEQLFSKYVGVKHSLSTNSCTASLFLSLLALGIGKGDEVITTPFTFAATLNTIIHVGAKPVLVDISPDTCNIDTSQVQDVVTSKTKAIVPVHFAGMAVEMDPLLKQRQENDLKIIEDCAHSVGTKYKGKHVGTFTDAGCFSFYATKNLSTGEGGMITTNSDAIVDNLKQLRLHGLSRDAWKRYGPSGSWKYDVVIPGYKYNMTDIQGALGLVQLQKLDNMNKRREELAKAYSDLLDGFDNIATPPHQDDRSWHLYTIQLKDGERAREVLMNAFSEKGIGFSVHFQTLHLQNAYSYLEYKMGSLPESERVSSSIISLPFYPQMTMDQVERVCKLIRRTL